MDDAPNVPISWGELIDKITILEIKKERISDPMALQNINFELNSLNQFIQKFTNDSHPILDIKLKLSSTNEKLWIIEDEIREKEKRQEFDDEFIHLARSVYKTNDLRAELKREINLTLKSKIIEEKGYTKY